MQFSLWALSLKLESQPKPKFKGSVAQKIIAKRDHYLEQMYQFLLNDVVVKSDWDYTVQNTPRKFTQNNNFFENNKLIVDSKTTLKRLRYWLYYNTTNNLEEVLDYHSKQYLENYYSDFKYFDKTPNQLIFIGNASITNWLTQTDPTKFVTYWPSSATQAPQFFMNWRLSEALNQRPKPVLLQNARSRGEAEGMCKVFAEQGYNPISTLERTDEGSVEWKFESGVLVSEDPERSEGDEAISTH